MRLIDADALIEYYKRLSNECFSKNNHEYANLYDCVCAKIATQPTAYDVSKVVAELESLSNAEADYYFASSNDVIDREKAIDIVKAGGVE